MRRCDHDADRAFNYQEFTEILGKSYEQCLQERFAEKQLVEMINKNALEARRKERELYAIEEQDKAKVFQQIAPRIVEFIQRQMTRLQELETEKKKLSFFAGFDPEQIFQQIDQKQ